MNSPHQVTEGMVVFEGYSLGKQMWNDGCSAKRQGKPIITSEKPENMRS
jgi:hypothetical protein